MIIGHQEIRKILSKLFKESKLPHALMLAGSAGIGKKLVAEEIANSLICAEQIYGGCGKCANCLPFLARNYPDIHRLNCEDKEQVSAEAIRQIINLLSLKSFGGQARIIIFENAESLSLTSCNILLKSLEEPRPNTYYIFVSANPSFIPITIRSRCQTYYLPDLKEAELEQIITNSDLKSKLPETLTIASILPYASGSLVSIHKIIEKPELWSSTKSFLSDFFAGKVHALLETVKPLSKEREDLIDFLFFVEIITRRQMLLQSNPEKKQMFAILLNNILLSKYYITQRNIHVISLLSAIFSDLNYDLGQENIENYII